MKEIFETFKPENSIVKKYVDWLSDMKLDTLKPKEDWHKELNFKINKWLDYDKSDRLTIHDVDKSAFDFPKKSGKVKAEYDNNTFRVETSDVQTFSINISPEMVSIKKKVKFT